MPLDDLDVDGQPNGERVEHTLAVVDRILADDQFAAEVASHNAWVVPADEHFRQGVALRFLTARYQWATSLLSTQTDTLKNQVASLENLVDDVQWELRRVMEDVNELSGRTN